jgi:hypothetical protein
MYNSEQQVYDKIKSISRMPILRDIPNDDGQVLISFLYSELKNDPNTDMIIDNMVSHGILARGQFCKNGSYKDTIRIIELDEIVRTKVGKTSMKTSS